jgi:hypothetical protein
MRTAFRFLIVLLAVVAFASPAYAGKKLEGKWTVNVTIPVAANSSTNRTFTIELDVSPRGDSLHGRMTITDDAGKTYAGVYRQVGKKIGITFELPCEGDGSSSCASLVLKGNVKNSGTTIKGDVVVMWDSSNDQNPALYDTSNGSFSGRRTQ